MNSEPEKAKVIRLKVNWTTNKKVGFVRLKGAGDRWEAAWRDQSSGKYVRRVLPASCHDEALAMARERNRQLASQTGYAPRLRGADEGRHSVSAAGLEAIQHSDAQERTKSDYLCRFNQFIDYLAQHHPGAAGWAEITESIVAHYRQSCRSLAHDTIRLRVFVLKMVSAYMARTYPGVYRDVAAHLAAPKKRKRRVASGADASAADILTPPQVKELLAWLAEHDRLVYTWACLEGLAGLRMTEAAYLRRKDINLAKGAIQITDTSAHDVKTDDSARLIPVCAQVTLALRQWLEDWPYKREHPEGYLFLPRKRRGNAKSKTPEARAGAYTQDAVKSLWSAALALARQELALPERFTAHRLRASFITALRGAGADFADLQCYVGQAPSTVLSANYDRVDLERLRAIAALAGRVFG